MAEITKIGGWYYYKNQICHNADEVYLKFRKDYNESQGRNSYKYLQHLVPREERAHDTGIVFSVGCEPRGFPEEKVECYQLGLVEGSYTKILSVPDYLDEDEAFEWIDWIFRQGGRNLRMVGRKQRTGRTGTGRKNIKRK